MRLICRRPRRLPGRASPPPPATGPWRERCRRGPRHARSPGAPAAAGDAVGPAVPAGPNPTRICWPRASRRCDAPCWPGAGGRSARDPEHHRSQDDDHADELRARRARGALGPLHHLDPRRVAPHAPGASELRGPDRHIDRVTGGLRRDGLVMDPDAAGLMRSQTTLNAPEVCVLACVVVAAGEAKLNRITDCLDPTVGLTLRADGPPRGVVAGARRGGGGGRRRRGRDRRTDA